MRVNYSPVSGVLMIVLGVANAALAGLNLMMGQDTLAIWFVVGPIFVLLGILNLVRPYFEFDPATRTVVIKALIGPVVRRFGGVNGDWLVVENGRIVCVRRDGRRKNVPVHRFFAKKDEWQTVLAWVAQPPPVPQPPPYPHYGS